ncbi:hypothetical protein ABSA28_00903 [Candidatus Hepatincolaceae symbiont of Richtersius coronifer]
MEKIIEFSTEVDEDILYKLEHLAKSENKPLQNLIHEALNDLLVKHNCKARAFVIEAFQKSLIQYSEIYKKLRD